MAKCIGSWSYREHFKKQLNAIFTHFVCLITYVRLFFPQNKYKILPLLMGRAQKKSWFCSALHRQLSACLQLPSTLDVSLMWEDGYVSEIKFKCFLKHFTHKTI